MFPITTENIFCLGSICGQDPVGAPNKVPNFVFSTQISKKGEVLCKEVFPATEFAVGLFPSFSRLRAASKEGGKDDDEPDAFWFFQDGKIIMQASARSLRLRFSQMESSAMFTCLHINIHR